MTKGKRRAGIAVAAAGVTVATVLAGFTLNQMTTDVVATWPWWLAAVVLGGVVLGLGWRVEELRDQTPPGPGLFDSVIGDDDPPRFADVTNEVLGVRVHEYGATRIQRLPGTTLGMPEGLPLGSRTGRSTDRRTIAPVSTVEETHEGDALSPGGGLNGDADARALLAQNPRLALACGPRLAGATTLLADAARAQYPRRRLLVMLDPTPDRVRAGYPVACDWASRGDGAVLWLERATAAVVETMTTLLAATASPAHLTVLATTSVETAVITNAPYLRVAELSVAEQAEVRVTPALSSLVPAMDAGQHLIGRLMLPLAAARHAVSVDGLPLHCAPQVAVLRAVVDWGRAEIPAAMTTEDLCALYPVYAQQVSALPVGGDPGYASSTVVPDQKISRQVRRQVKDAIRALGTDGVGNAGGNGSHGWLTRLGRNDLRADALLRVVADDTTRPRCSWSICDAVWGRAAAILSPQDASRLGRHQLAAGQPWAGYLLLHNSPDQLTPAEWDSLGFALANDERFDGAREAYQRAIDSGHPDAAPRAWLNLGNLEQLQGPVRVEEARKAFRQAINSGHPDVAPQAWVGLGFLERLQGPVRVEEAREAYRQAIDSGHPDMAPTAWVSLGNLELNGPGRVEKAREAYRQAIDSGHPDVAPRAWINLGNLEQEQGPVRVEEAREAFRQAINSGHPDAAPLAWVELGHLEQLQGPVRVEEAREAFRRAIDSGHPDAAPLAWVGLGFLEVQQQGPVRVEEAREAFRRAIDSGHPDAAPRGWLNLGHLEQQQGRVGAKTVREAYRQAIDSGHPDVAPMAWVNLGSLEQQQGLGRVEEARKAYRQAIDSGHPDAAPRAWLNLGILEQQQGPVRAKKAREAYRQAINSGHPDVAATANSALREMEEQEQKHLNALRQIGRGY